MAAVPPIRELERLCGGEGRGVNEPFNVRYTYARAVRKLSIRTTWLLLHTSVSANQVTVLGIVIGLAGAGLLAWNNLWAQLGGIAALQLSFVIDFSDGEIARFKSSANAGGAYLDWIGHYYVPAAAVAALAYAVLHAFGHTWVLLAALITIFGMVRIACSARDHVLLGIYRDRPELREDPQFVRAVLARQGGDPERIDLDADYAGRRAGGEGAGPLWHRFTNLGQLFVYPGFVNIVTLAIGIDIVTSLAMSDYPDLTSSKARQALLGVLALMQLLHQLRAAGQSYAILRGLR